VAYLAREALEAIGFASLGREVKVSDRAAIYDPELIHIGDHSRIDDFCVLSGKIRIGRNVHIAVFCNLAGGQGGIELHDFAGLAYGSHVIAQTDDYSGRTMTNPTVPREFTGERAEAVSIGRHSILGAGTIVLPGVVVAEGVSTGAMTLLNRPTEAWAIYVGSPARRVKERSRALLELERQYLDRERG
jgi:acetyltransferase-like isoleucine patch superfamily enzyme